MYAGLILLPSMPFKHLVHFVYFSVKNWEKYLNRNEFPSYPASGNTGSCSHVKVVNHIHVVFQFIGY